MTSIPAAISLAVFSLLRPSAVAEMISERYFSSDRVLISLRRVAWPVALIPVRSRLMKAVFFLRDESSEEATENRSGGEMISLDF